MNVPHSGCPLHAVSTCFRLLFFVALITTTPAAYSDTVLHDWTENFGDGGVVVVQEGGQVIILDDPARLSHLRFAARFTLLDVGNRDIRVNFYDVASYPYILPDKSREQVLLPEGHLATVIVGDVNVTANSMLYDIPLPNIEVPEIFALTVGIVDARSGMLFHVGGTQEESNFGRVADIVFPWDQQPWAVETGAGFWSHFQGLEPMAFSIEGVLIPERSSITLMSLAAVSLAIRHVRRS